MTRQAYPTDLNVTQWALIAPLLPKRQSTRGRARTRTDRDIVDAILYIVRGGSGWRLMPHDLPPWQTAYGYYWQWRNSGLWEQINTLLVQKVRTQQGREPQPSAGIIDSQSVKTSEGGEERGVDVYKQVSGRKRHILVDMLGLLLLVLVTVLLTQIMNGAAWMKINHSRKKLSGTVFVKDSIPQYLL